MRKTEDKHLFAVFVGNLFAQQKPRKDAVITITDQDLVHRIVTVLRMLIGEELQLFDDHDYYLAKITDIKKNKAINLQIISVAPNPKPKLEINFLLPLLKKEALEETIYSLTEIGVSSIQLLITDKSQKNLSDKEIARLKKLTEIREKKIFKVFCAIGPEGGLTPNETQLLVRYGFKMCKLTSTTLRAMQAAAVGAGLLASIL